MRNRLSYVAVALMMGLCAATLHGQGQAAPSNEWLIDAPNDVERFKLLQRYLRGFDQPMWEVGERYEGVHDALQRSNFDLALYHWDKIKTTIENGYLKRPARRANSDALFLSKVWGEVRAAIESRDSAKAWAGFTAGRAACQACHQAEMVGYMNNQPMFEKTAPAR